MPIYEYVCSSCQHRIELKQRLSDPPLSHCTRCGSAVTKVISPPALMFKGSGWYVTDYSDKLKPPTPKTESSEKPASGQPEQKPAVASSSASTTSASTDGGSASGSGASSTSSPGSSSS